jgi:hypothetical protein
MPLKEEFKITKSDFNDLKEFARSRRRPGMVFEVEPAISVLVEEENEIVIKPEKKRLSKEEKLALSKKLAGSADRFSLEGVEETIRIANRDYDREEEA